MSEFKLDMTLEEQRPKLGQPRKAIVKKQITFRLPPELIDRLREMPNQSKFIEEAILSKLNRK